MYKLLNKKVIGESKHTLTPENWSVLRKSGVSEKANKSVTISPKEKIPKPSTMMDIKKRWELKQAQRTYRTNATEITKLG